MISIQSLYWCFLLPYNTLRCVWQARTAAAWILSAFIWFIPKAYFNKFRGVSQNSSSISEEALHHHLSSLMKWCNVQDLRVIYSVFDGINKIIFKIWAVLYMIIKPFWKNMPEPFLRFASTKFSKPSKSNHRDCVLTVDWLYVGDQLDTKSLDGVILYIHGGAFICGSITTSAKFLGSLIHMAKKKNLKIAVCAPRYTLAPEARYPVAIDEVRDVYAKFLIEQCRVKAKKIIVMGDSAGGNLVTQLSISLRDSSKSHHVEQPSGIVLISPWLDLSCSLSARSKNINKDWLSADMAKLQSFARMYTREIPMESVSVSPYFASLNNLPPHLMVLGEDEVLLHEGVTYCDRATKSSTQVELILGRGMSHGYVLYPFGMESLIAAHKISDFIVDRLRRGAVGVNDFN